MTWKPLFATVALVLSLALPIRAAAQDQEDLTISGKIGRVEADGRINVGGHRILVDDDTEITDQAHRSVKRVELRPGIEVEVTYEVTSKGDYAKTISATLFR